MIVNREVIAQVFFDKKNEKCWIYSIYHGKSVREKSDFLTKMKKR